MKNLLILMLLIISSTARAEWDPGFYGGRGENSKFNLLWKDIASADHDIEYMGNDELSIGLGITKDGAITPQTHSLEELANYFASAKHKEFVVVMFHKNAPSKITLAEAIRELNEFFFKNGFKRVLLTGAHSSGTTVYSDEVNPKMKGKK